MIQRSATRDWSSLTPDLISHIGDLLLATSDVDGYMDMRAVCHGWRSAVADPRPHGAADPRFCPRQWVMLEEGPNDDDDDEGRLFVNVSTGRFFRRRLPLLRTGHGLVGASDGLLVLATSRGPHDCCVLNPLTGNTVRFAAPIALDLDGGLVAVAAGSEPMLLLAITGAMCGRPQAWFADPASLDFYCRLVASSTPHITAMVAYASQVYMAYTDGSVVRRTGSARQGHEELIIAAGNQADQPEAVFLVESAGELLLVLRQPSAFRVFRVDVERKALEPATTSIGGRALFLGRRCLSVAADKFLNIEGDCLYYATSLFTGQNPELQCMYRFRINGGLEALVSSNMDPMWSHRDESLTAYRPLCIDRIFLDYCLNLPDLWEQLL